MAKHFAATISMTVWDDTATAEDAKDYLLWELRSSRMDVEDIIDPTMFTDFKVVHCQELR